SRERDPLTRGRVQAVGVPELHPITVPGEGDTFGGSYRSAPAFLPTAHLVFVTKYRHRVFGDRHLARMEEVMRAVCDDFEVQLVEWGGEANHVHLLVNFPHKVALSKLVNSLKGVSSRTLKQEFPDLVRRYWLAQRLWSG